MPMTTDAIACRALEIFAQLPMKLAAQADPVEKTTTNRQRPAFTFPLTWQDAVGWLVDHGPKLLGIMLAMWLLRIVVNRASQRLLKLIGLAAGRGNLAERENRANTLSSVFRSTASVLILVGGILMILQELSVPIAPLLGGVAVVGLAVAFGAQNLIRDYFTGLTILLEDQYGVNDVVKIAGIAGSVERITLRVTVLRDLEGVAHFIPLGQVTTVSNMTHGWSRALFEIGIAYKEDADRVMQVLMQLACEARQDELLGPLILDDPQMLGVDQLGDSAVIVKFFIRTRPLQQWTVKRALLGRIKKRFDELGIEIPFPQRTVFLRPDGELAVNTAKSPAKTPQ